MSCVKMRTIVKQKKMKIDRYLYIDKLNIIDKINISTCHCGFLVFICFDDLTLTDYTKQYWSRCFLHNGLTWRDVTSASPVYTYPAAVHQ